jgi:glycosyltransferase involved in cell wall biosynthesis
MRVLQVSKFYPPVMGGIESVAWELTEGLNRAGVHTDVLCANQHWRTRRERAAAGYEIVRVGSLGMLLSTSMAPAMAWHLARMARDCDVVHLHMPDPMAALALWWARPKARVVVHWHSDVVRQRWAMRLYGPLQDWLLRRADAVVATSEAYATASPPLQAVRDKVVIVPIGVSDLRPGVDAGRVDEIRRRYGGRRIVFALGRMTHYKGFDFLVRAAALLPKDCVVVIGGAGEGFDVHRASVSRLGLAGKVDLLGHVPDPDLVQWFASCDVFCMPSTLRAEAYGVAMVEAMMLGKPVVATDIAGSGLPWVNVHGETGLNVPPCDAEALAQALGRLLGDAEVRLAMGRAARRRFERELDAGRMVRATLAIYDSSQVWR